MKTFILSIFLSSYLFSYSIAGVGQFSCGSFLSQEESYMRELYIQYAYGYFAGSETDLASIDFKSVELYLINECNSNPIQLFVDALSKLEKDIKQR